MRLIKRLDAYLLKAYLQLFAGTFFICLFIFLMQFTWRYVNELIGKGLTMDVLIRFFWYASLTLVPMSLPLAILLAALITFGNLGERLELLSMKAAGISLLRIFVPIFLFIALLCTGNYFFQNKVGPEATKQLASLVWSMKQKSPELEIPEGIFYNQIPGYNIYVEKKNRQNGMLYGVMIYSTTDGYEDAQIILADSGRLQSTADRMYLQLTLYGGERFRNMGSQSGGQAIRANVPYMRESFIQEVDLIPFDGNFNITDAELFSGNAATKDIKLITAGIDSLNHLTDSVGRSVYSMILNDEMYRRLSPGRDDSAKVVASVATSAPFDTVMRRLNDAERKEVWRIATTKSRQLASQYEYRDVISYADLQTLREHNLEWHKKFTLSMACMIFFLIGAPLGAIIRKGGLGLPVVVSVLIFIFYYIINVSGEKLAKNGSLDITFGAWFSSMVLAPIAIWLVYKANDDSAVFDMDGYRIFFRRFFGLRIKRAINRKEAVICDPDYRSCHEGLLALAEQCRSYTQVHRLWLMPSYIRIFFHYRLDTQVSEISEQMETLIKELHNSSDSMVVGMLNMFPVLSVDAHTRPFRSARLNVAAGIFFPVGVFFWFRIWRFRLRLKHDMDTIQRLAPELASRLEPLMASDKSDK